MATKTSAARDEASVAHPGWLVTVRVKLNESLTSDTVDRIEEVLADSPPALHVGPYTITAIFMVAARTPQEAQRKAAPLVKELLAVIGSRNDAILSLYADAVEDDDVDDGIPDHVGLSEVAMMLGVSRQRVHQLTERPDFPAMEFKLRATPVWSKWNIKAFRRAWRGNDERRGA